MFGHYATHCPQRNKNSYDAVGGDGANGGLEDDQMMPESNNSLMQATLANLEKDGHNGQHAMKE